MLRNALLMAFATLASVIVSSAASAQEDCPRGTLDKI